MFQAVLLKHHDTMGNGQAKKLSARQVADDDHAFRKKVDVGITNYVDDTAEQQIISWQTGPTKAATAERWAQIGVADVTKEKKNSALTRVQHIKNGIGKADNAAERAKQNKESGGRITGQIIKTS